MGKVIIESSHENVIRSRLLNRLGIYQSYPVEQMQQQNIIRNVSLSSPPPSPCTIDVRREALKDSGSVDDDSCPVRKRQITFDSTVTVFSIPSRFEYSNRVKKFLWNGGREIKANAERNLKEFAAEGWNWHTVLEDEDMLVDAKTGELVHPCWFDVGDKVETPAEMEEDCLDIAAPNLKRCQGVVGLHDLHR